MFNNWLRMNVKNENSGVILSRSDMVTEAYPISEYPKFRTTKTVVLNRNHVDYSQCFLVKLLFQSNLGFGCSSINLVQLISPQYTFPIGNTPRRSCIQFQPPHVRDVIWLERWNFCMHLQLVDMNVVILQMKMHQIAGRRLLECLLGYCEDSPK